MSPPRVTSNNSTPRSASDSRLTRRLSSLPPRPTVSTGGWSGKSSQSVTPAAPDPERAGLLRPRPRAAAHQRLLQGESLAVGRGTEVADAEDPAHT